MRINHLAENSDKKQTLVKAVMNLGVL